VLLSQIKTDSAILQKVFSFWEEARPNLSTFPLENYEPRTRSMQSVLGIEGASQKQVLKQPDVLMLLYLISEQYSVTSSEGSYGTIGYDAIALIQFLTATVSPARSPGPDLFLYAAQQLGLEPAYCVVLEVNWIGEV